LTVTPSRSYTTVAVAIVVAGVLIAVILFVAVPSKTVTTTETSISTTAATTTQTATVPPSSTVTAVYYVQTGPVQVVLVQFVNNSSKEPISGVTIGGSFQPDCPGDLPFPIQGATTSSNGTLALSIDSNALGAYECTVGTYSLTLQYSRQRYNLTLNPSSWYLAQTVAYTVGLPSGDVLGLQVTNH